MEQKVFGCTDMSEVRDLISEDIYKRLIRYANDFGKYQPAIDKVQKELDRLILCTPHNRDMIKEAADMAGERFLKIIGEAKAQNQLFTMGPGGDVKFGNISIKQSPPKP